MAGLNTKIAENYTELLKSRGDDFLYRHCIAYGVKRSVDVINPEVEMLDLSESFLVMYRRTGDENYATIGRILRKAAHTLYRQFLKIYENKSRNARFIQAVK